MAFLDLDLDANRLVITFDQKLTRADYESPQVTFLAPNDGGTPAFHYIGLHYGNLGNGPKLYINFYPETLLGFLFPRWTDVKVGFMHGDQFMYQEPLRISSLLLSTQFDPLKLNCNKPSSFVKPGKVAVFTQSYNEGAMLGIWEKYYAGLVGHENLYVLNNGSTDGSCERLHPKTNVVTMPAGSVDHENFAQLQGYFQRFLLQRYQWVVKIDTDELIVCEGDMVQTLLAMPDGVYAPDIPVAVIHEHGKETPFDFTRPIHEQRHHYVHEHISFQKPTIASVPTTWSLGNHMSYERSTTIPGFYLVHVRFVDFEHLLGRNHKWAALPQTAEDAQIYHGITHFKDKAAQEIYDDTLAELKAKFDEPVVEVPKWLTDKI